MSLYFINKENPVSTYEDLKQAYLDHPKKVGSWGDKKSAESMANYWFNKDHKNFNSILMDMFGEFSLGDGYFEYCTIFDESTRGPREHDMCFPYVNAGVHTITIGIEAKGNEPYDKLISKQIEIGQRKISDGKNTKLLDRVQSMYLAMGEPSQSRLRSIKDFFSIRYQLFSGLCGTIAEANAQHSNTALFLILQFETEIADQKSLDRNKTDLLDFLKFMRISNDIKSGQILNISAEFKEVDDFKIKYSTKDLEVYIGYLNIKLD